LFSFDGVVSVAEHFDDNISSDNRFFTDIVSSLCLINVFNAVLVIESLYCLGVRVTILIIVSAGDEDGVWGKELQGIWTCRGL